MELANLSFLASLVFMSVAGTDVWRSVYVLKTNLGSTNLQNKSTPTFSAITCAAIASQTSWANLFCLEQSLCFMSSFMVLPSTSYNDAQTNCHTRLDLQGESCAEGYSFVADLGCVKYFSNKLAWGDAKKTCSSFGASMVSFAQLPTTTDMNILATQIGATSGFWVDLTLKNSMFVWPNGESAAGPFWASGNPLTTADSNVCIRTSKSNNYLLINITCSTIYTYLCSLP